MVAAWIGKGAMTPFWVSLRTIPSGNPRSPKVISGVFGVAGASAASAASVVSTASAVMLSAESATLAESWESIGSLESFSGMTAWSVLEMDMRNAKPSGVSARAQTP